MEYFEFPIILIDPDYEQSKRERAINSTDSSAEYAVGSCEVLAEARLIRIADSWLPTEEDFLKSLDGEFTACTVVFDGLGTFEVPMKKERFKRMYNKFLEETGILEPKIGIVHLKTEEEVKDFFTNIIKQQNEQTKPESDSTDEAIGGL